MTQTCELENAFALQCELLDKHDLKLEHGCPSSLPLCPGNMHPQTSNAIQCHWGEGHGRGGTKGREGEGGFSWASGGYCQGDAYVLRKLMQAGRHIWSMASSRLQQEWAPSASRHAATTRYCHHSPGTQPLPGGVLAPFISTSLCEHNLSVLGCRHLTQMSWTQPSNQVQPRSACIKYAVITLPCMP